MLNMRVLLLEIIRQPERNNGQAGFVIGRTLSMRRKDGFCNSAERSLAMDPADTGEPSGPLQCLAQKACVSQAVLHDLPVPVESKVYQVVILPDHLRSGTREIERIGFFSASQVVQLEDQILGQV